MKKLLRVPLWRVRPFILVAMYALTILALFVFYVAMRVVIARWRS